MTDTVEKNALQKMPTAMELALKKAGVAVDKGYVRTEEDSTPPKPHVRKPGHHQRNSAKSQREKHSASEKVQDLEKQVANMDKEITQILANAQAEVDTMVAGFDESIKRLSLQAMTQNDLVVKNVSDRVLDVLEHRAESIVEDLRSQQESPKSKMEHLWKTYGVPATVGAASAAAVMVGSMAAKKYRSKKSE